MKKARRERIASARRAGERGLAALTPRDLEALASDPDITDGAPARAASMLLAGPPGRRIRGAAAHGRPWWRRSSALRILLRGGDPGAVAALRDALFSGDRDLTRTAVALLGQAATRAAAEVLVDGLVRDIYPASRIATALERNGTPVPDLLRPLLRSDTSRLRYWAALLLAKYPREAGLDVELAELTRDSEPTIRKAAIQSLGAVGGPLAAAEASRLAADPVEFVRTHAARARVLAAGGGR